jgi:hypothetical protein
MKQTLIVLFSFVWLHLNAQKSEQIIPQEAVTVFSINNISLLQKVTIDELIEYDFMDEIHQELFDGSTDQKSLKDAGIDFDQRLNIFYGKNLKYELSGFTFGLKNKTDFFEGKKRILHFAPEKCLHDVIRQYPNLRYETADLMTTYIDAIGVIPAEHITTYKKYLEECKKEGYPQLIHIRQWMVWVAYSDPANHLRHLNNPHQWGWW